VCCGHGRYLAGALDAAAPGCAGILSFGIAGGLDPALRPGAVIVASSVIGPERRLPTHDAWSRALLAAAADAVHAPLLGTATPALDPAAKAALHRQTAAAAVDMESHIAAAAAAELHVPFAVLRVVADPADQHVPRAALVGMRADGSLDVGAVLGALLRKPSELAPLMRVARHTGRARAVLADLRRHLGPGFGLFDLV
jgi:hopanoid-associated phosphorylase